MNVLEMSDEQLRETAARLKLKIPPGKFNRTKLEERVGIASHKHQLGLEEKAKAERAKEIAVMQNLKPGTKAKPAPETLAILNSKKVYAIFRNLEQPDTDVEFNKGCTHTFHLWDGYIHILPMSIIDESRDMSNPIGKTPIHAVRPHPTHPDITGSQIVGHKRRYSFEVIEGTPPVDSGFGVILDKKLYEKLNQPYPQPVAQSI